jgi:uncharacterized BrkB/YihY/UPF0761 family membrane protein
MVVTASGVFGEMQSALNVIWKTKPRGTTVSRLIRARATPQIFLLGAEFTKAYANRHGSKRDQPVVDTGRPT